MARHRLHNATCGDTAPVRLNPCHPSSLDLNTGDFGELMQFDTSLGSSLGITPRHRIMPRRRAVLVPQPRQYRQSSRTQIKRRYQLARFDSEQRSTSILVDAQSSLIRSISVSWYRRSI